MAVTLQAAGHEIRVQLSLYLCPRAWENSNFKQNLWSQEKLRNASSCGSQTFFLSLHPRPLSKPLDWPLGVPMQLGRARRGQERLGWIPLEVLY